MTFPRPFLLAALLGLAAGCRIADPDRPLWLEAHGHSLLTWIAAFENGALGVAPGGRIVRAPGEFDKPWQDQMPADGTQIAARGDHLWTLASDGAVTRRSLRNNDPVSLTNGGGIQRFAVGSGGDVHVISGNHPYRLVEGRLVDAPCTARAGSALAVGRDGTYVVSAGGALLLQTQAGACQPVPLPFAITDVAATDVAGAGFDVAAVDGQGQAWVRTGGQWEKLPYPTVYRRGRWPQMVAVAQVALSAQAFWARSVEGLVFLLSDPR